MYCRNCGNEINNQAVVCIHCGCPLRIGGNFCQKCGVATLPEQIVCVRCGCAVAKPVVDADESDGKSRVAAALLGIFLGWLGIHKFYLGYGKEGVIELVLTFVTCGFAGIIGLIEGFVYLTKTDKEFYRIYVKGQRAWF